MFAVSFAVYNAIDNSLNMLLQCFIHAVQLNSNARKHLISQMILDVLTTFCMYLIVSMIGVSAFVALEI
jgi:hypothetical protein